MEKNCWWPPKCRDNKSLRKFIDLGYLPDQTTWKSYPAKMRKQYSKISKIIKFSNLENYKIFAWKFFVTFEEAVQHENKAVDNPSGDIESTDNEKEKRSKGIRKKKFPFDPSSSPVVKNTRQLPGEG